jgi:hypothetical protein
VPSRVLLILLAALAFACGGSDSGNATATPTTTAAPSSTATRAPAVYAVDNPTLAPPAPMTGSEGASGSGCPAGGGPPDDGIWYGFVTASTDSSITFELACLYFGDAAWEEAAKEGTEAPNDVYIRATDRIFEVPVREGATAYTIVSPVNAELRIDAISFSDWPQDPLGYTPCPGKSCTVWLYVNDGTVTEVLEQYLP